MSPLDEVRTYRSLKDTPDCTPVEVVHLSPSTPFLGDNLDLPSLCNFMKSWLFEQVWLNAVCMRIKALCSIPHQKTHVIRSHVKKKPSICSHVKPIFKLYFIVQVFALFSIFFIHNNGKKTV